MEVRWTVQAADDLVAIRDFIARDSPTYARHVVQRLFETASQRQPFPDAGRVVPERGDPRRPQSAQSAVSHRISTTLSSRAVGRNAAVSPRRWNLDGDGGYPNHGAAAGCSSFARSTAYRSDSPRNGGITSGVGT
ncbi:MAG: type II toxin-antitoxin system RelE/ParE family toxin, partial [Gemmatimonadota bacterium]